MFDPLDLRPLFVMRLVIVKKIDQSVRPGKKILGDLGKHREKGGVLAHEAKHCGIRLRSGRFNGCRSKLVNISSIRTRVNAGQTGGNLRKLWKRITNTKGAWPRAPKYSGFAD